MTAFLISFLAYLCPCGLEHSPLHLKEGRIVIEGEQIDVELALTHTEHCHGLMGRAGLADHHGMLFVYQEAHILSFWMKGTLIPLSIAFFDKNRKLTNIEEMAVPNGWALPQYKSKTKALYALEMPAEWFKQHKIQEGAVFEWKIRPF